MSNLDKINLDSLYERKRAKFLNRLKIYDKILERIHKRIKVTSRQQVNQQHCFFVVPEFILGIPKYDISTCISYIIEKLQENGFFVKYTHPNLLFISWKHYIPYYERQEYKKKTGLSIDGFGNKMQEKREEPKQVKPILKKNFKDITTYKPTGGLIYNTSTLKKITTKLDK